MSEQKLREALEKLVARAKNAREYRDGRWLAFDTSQEEQVLAMPAPEPQGVRLTQEQVMQAINFWRSTGGTLPGATDMLNAALAASPATVAGAAPELKAWLKDFRNKLVDGQILKESDGEPWCLTKSEADQIEAYLIANLPNSRLTTLLTGLRGLWEAVRKLKFALEQPVNNWAVRAKEIYHVDSGDGPLIRDRAASQQSLALIADALNFAVRRKMLTEAADELTALDTLVRTVDKKAPVSK